MAEKTTPADVTDAVPIMKRTARTNPKTQPKTNVAPLKLLTTGQVAAELGVRIHRVLHILRTRPHIQPLCTAGHYRLYSRNALSEVRKELGLDEEPAPATVCTGGWVQGAGT